MLIKESIKQGKMSTIPFISVDFIDFIFTMYVIS